MHRGLLTERKSGKGMDHGRSDELRMSSRERLYHGPENTFPGQALQHPQHLPETQAFTDHSQGKGAPCCF